MSAATRATRKRIVALFSQLVRQLGPAARGWELDHAGPYGGYVVTSDHGSGRPLGHRRRAGGEMCEALNFAIDVMWARGLALGLDRDAEGCPCVERGAAQ